MRVLLAVLAPTTIIWLSGCTSIDHSAACNHFLAQASSASAAHDYTGAQKDLSEAAREAELSDDTAQKRRVLREQASTYLNQHNPAAAEATARQLIKIYDGKSEKNMSTSNRSDLAEDRSRARIILSDALLAQKRPDLAAAVLAQARAEMENIYGSPELVGTIEDRYSSALRASGRPANRPGISLEGDILSTSEADGLTNQARDLQSHGRNEEAIGLLKKAQQLAASSGAQDAYVRAICQLASTQYVLNRATEAYEQALKACQSVRTKTNVTSKNKSAALALLALTSPDPREAAGALKEGLSIDAGAAFDPIWKVASMETARPAAAKIRECELLWSLALKASPDNRTQALWHRYQVFSEIKNKDPAVSWFCHQAQSPLLMPTERMDCYQLAANLLLADQRVEQARQILRQALSYREHLKKRDLPDTWDRARWLADDYYALNRPQEAIAAAEHSLSLLPANPEAVADPGVLAHINLVIAKNCLKVHEYRKALEYYDTTIVFARKGKLAELQELLAERSQLAAQIKHESQK